MLDRLPLPARYHQLIKQLLRFGVTGGLLTLFSASTYWVFVSIVDVSPLIANTIAFLAAVGLGYMLHSRISFRDTAGGASAMQGGRFFVTAGVSFSLNTFFVWMLTGVLRGPEWWPMVTMVFVTPLISFIIYRKWVFA